MTVEEPLDVTAEKDGGVLKTICQQGIGSASPSSGDTVYVHYVGTLEDGTEFDSSRKRGEPFHFNLGRGNVIKGWDVGVATMKKSEIAVLKCRADYAYGENGSPPKIPANATLNFEVELLRWEGEDISPDRDKTIVRSIQTSGPKYEVPNEGSTCQAHIIGRVGDATFFDEEVSLVLGEATELGLPEGIDKALKRFRQGEKSLLQIKPKWGYGSAGKADWNIPPDATLEFEVELKSFEKVKDSWQMTKGEKLDESEKLKGKGTDFFQQGKYRLALCKYTRIVDLLRSEDDTLEGDEKTRRDTLYIAAELNSALCNMKMGDPVQCIKHCDMVLEIQPDNVKALYRKGMALQEGGDYETAISVLSRVIELEPRNAAATQAIRQCKQKVKEQLDKEKKTFANMFTKFAQQDYKTELSRKTAEKADTATGAPGEAGDDA